jgi:hemerythrin superfamily protein
MSVGNAQQSQSRDVVDLLLSQHEEVRSLFGQIQGAAGTAKKGSFDRLVNLLAVHETAEEIVVYPVVRKTGPDGERLADARTAEEDKAKDALSELEKLEATSAEFDTKLQAFQQMVETHAGNEEREILPLLRQSQSPEELTRMAEAVEAAEKMAPTHPHPHGPESAVGNLVVGPFVAIVDKVRDALRSHARS